MNMLERARQLYQPLRVASNISVETFERDFAYPQQPLVMKGMADKWPAMERWRLQSLRDRLGTHTVKVMKSSDESEVYMTLEKFISYMQTATEEHSYYIRNWLFAEDFPAMRHDYEILPHFNNWLDSLPEAANPKFRWLFIGPRNSYSKLHLDVFLTNAWNVLIEGSKLWLFFPPDDNFSFRDLEYDPLFPGYQFPNKPGLKGYYAVQEPGDIMFTPGSWYHQVFNLDNTVALTENYVNHTNYRTVEDFLRETENFPVLEVLGSLKTNFL